MDEMFEDTLYVMTSTTFSEEAFKKALDVLKGLRNCTITLNKRVPVTSPANAKKVNDYIEEHGLTEEDTVRVLDMFGLPYFIMELGY